MFNISMSVFFYSLTYIAKILCIKFAAIHFFFINLPSSKFSRLCESILEFTRNVKFKKLTIMEYSVKVLSARLRVLFSRQLKQKVIESGISQKQLAYELGIDPSDLSRILNGRHSYGVDMLIAILARLNFRLFVYPYD